jgi:hypothetical protein
MAQRNLILLLSLAILIFTQCTDKCGDKQTVDMKNITEITIKKVQGSLIDTFGIENKCIN